ncbi:N-acetylglucosamine kinase-like BadF-type ATPase [Sphingopyxis panaciterrae]|uniref:N-acetylglucosamine kinase n=1 Tax=Sphingopyxis panaciterrae TaxID=363841 RepID=UPI001420E054|nr:BadF/BadG/BcrA/BcrD ATPase family protein [Sphingopyxis panaciterrae]NIJ35534.1 N-acetylglucosamine kinase-like BadF-type ATPase [Sphingopyxis panaciterrae]
MTGGIFLGVDGGGTKTEFVCIDAAGAVIARAVTGTTYHLQVGVDEAVRRLDQGIMAVCDTLGVTPAALDHSFFGLPAYGEDGVIDPQLDAACARLLGHDRYLCGNDMICGWAGSLGCEDGINIVAGTGSIGYGEREGQSARAGGWGEVFGDEGSAYWIAVQGLALFARMSDGRAPKDVLHDRIVDALSLDHDLELCERIMGTDRMGRGEIAGLASVVSKAAAEGDRGAAAILNAAAAELAAIAGALRKSLGFPDGMPVSISWSGGVLSQEPLVRRPFLEALEEKEFRFVEPRFAPGHGAALYARKQALRLSESNEELRQMRRDR